MSWLNSKFNLGYCMCGCQTEISIRSKGGKSKLQLFSSGHNLRLKQPDTKGSKNGRWKGGRLYTSFGYVQVINKDHNFADSKGYVMEHRLVWEKYNNAVLLPWAIIHHKNGIRNDNRIENLEPMIRSNHAQLHNPKTIPLDRKCEICNKMNDRKWRRNFLSGKGYLCDTCYAREKRPGKRLWIG